MAYVMLALLALAVHLVGVATGVPWPVIIVIQVFVVGLGLLWAAGRYRPRHRGRR